MQLLISFGFLALFVLLGILFLNTLADTVRFIRPSNQKIDPIKVWLLLVPIFNYFWYYVIVERIADSIKAEYYSRNIEIENKPTFAIGRAAAIFFSLTLVISFSNAIGFTFTFSFVYRAITTLIYLAGIIVWIVYWAQVAQYKNSIKAFTGKDAL